MREAVFAGRRDGPPAAAPAARPPRASVIVVCWDSEDVIARCVRALLAQDHPDYEVIVVDDGSRDRTAELAEAAAAGDPRLTVVRGGRNRGCPGARNLGIRHARGEIVAFVDADGFPRSEWLGRIAAAFAAEEDVGGIASTVFYADNPIVLNGAGGTVNRQGWAADLSMNESYEVAEPATEALYPMGCGMAFTQAALERIGPFDDRMLNYYDDVDYGIRAWRAGYRIAVAGDAWIEHAADASDSRRKRLLCERHRMRVSLKHMDRATLAQWSAHEFASWRAAPRGVRARKLRALAWNVRHAPSLIAERRRLRSAPAVPERLVDPSWGDAFPAGLAVRSDPDPQCAQSRLAAEEPLSERQLLHGWFPLERREGRAYRWAGAHAAALLSLAEPARRLRLDYAPVPEDIGEVGIAVRRADAGDPNSAAWSVGLRWQYAARCVENHPLELAPGDYEVVFSVPRGWREPPSMTRSLSLALASMSFESGFALESDGLEMGSPASERQLVRGWFEREPSPAGAYRWSSAHAAAVVRVGRETSAVRLRYRMTPGRSGPVSVSLAPLGISTPDRRDATASWRIPWEPGDWREQAFAARLEPGEYLLELSIDEPWSNREGRDASLPPENRSLGIALATLVPE